jgi:hypothetical protein
MINFNEFKDYVENITDLNVINELKYAKKKYKIGAPITLNDVKNFIHHSRNDTYSVIELQEKNIKLKNEYPNYNYIEFYDTRGLNYCKYFLKIQNENKDDIIIYCLITFSYEENYEIKIKKNNVECYEDSIVQDDLFDVNFVNLLKLENIEIIEYLNILKYVLSHDKDF